MTKRIPWQEKNRKQRVVTSIAMIAIIASISIAAYALGTHIFHLHQNVDNTRGVKIAGSWLEDNIEGKEVLPGDTFQLTQTITSDSTEPVYVFVRIDTEGNVYRMSDLHSDWSVAKAADGVILLAYGSEDAMEKLTPDAAVEFGGVLTLDVSNSQFAEMSDSALDFTINACGIAVSKCEGRTGALDVYEVYENEGGD